MKTLSEYVTLEEAAALVGITGNHFHHLHRTKQIQSCGKVAIEGVRGRPLRIFRRLDVEALKQRREQQREQKAQQRLDRLGAAGFIPVKHSDLLALTARIDQLQRDIDEARNGRGAQA